MAYVYYGIRDKQASTFSINSIMCSDDFYKKWDGKYGWKRIEDTTSEEIRKFAIDNGFEIAPHGGIY